MNRYDEKWEDQINALLDGELSEIDADLLKDAAGSDGELARAIIEAHQLQQAMNRIGVERAPASLKKRLRAIPRQEKPGSGFSILQPRWAMALAVIPLIVIVTTVMRPQEPSAREIAQARQDLAVAFAYLDRAGDKTSREIESVVGSTMSDAIAGTVIRNVKSQL
jgi:hypothetical protein